MTDAERLNAARDRLILFDPDRWDADEVRSLVFDLDEILADYPEPDDGP